MANEAAVEAMMELVCDHYCKYPYICNKEELESICDRCSIEEHIRNMGEDSK